MKSLLKNTVVTGERVPRKPEAMILDDMQDIVAAVKRSGLPDAFFTEECCVYEQIQSVGWLLNLTPKQVTLLALAVELSGSSITIKNMASYCRCTETRFHSMYWDFMKLRVYGYLELVDANAKPWEYALPFGIIAFWGCDKVYHSKIVIENLFRLNGELIERVLQGVIWPYAKYMPAPVPVGNVHRYLDLQLDYFDSSPLVKRLDRFCSTLDCSNPSLAIKILLLVIAHTFRALPDMVMGKKELQDMLLDNPSDSERDEFFHALDSLVKAGHIQFAESSYKLTEKLSEWIGSDLDVSDEELVLSNIEMVTSQKVPIDLNTDSKC